MSVRHVALFRWRDRVTSAQVEAVERALRALPGAIPAIRDYRFGRDLGVNEGNADFAVVADFDSLDDYLAYRDHPEHRAFLTGVVGPLLASRVTVQYETG